MNKENLEAYAEIKKQIAELEKKADEIRPLIVQEMVENDAEKVELKGYGDFIINKRRTWEFSDNVKIAQDNLDELMAKEKADGTATYVEAPILKFILKK